MCILVGLPALCFLYITTWGAILMPLGGFLILAPFLLLSYLTWGVFVKDRKPRKTEEKAE